MIGPPILRNVDFRTSTHSGLANGQVSEPGVNLNRLHLTGVQGSCSTISGTEPRGRLERFAGRSEPFRTSEPQMTHCPRGSCVASLASRSTLFSTVIYSHSLTCAIWNLQDLVSDWKQNMDRLGTPELSS